MIRTGRVVEVIPASGQARVAVDGLTGCERCRRGRSCSLSPLLPASPDEVILSCYTSCPVVVEQRVSIEIEDGDSRWMLGVAAAYGLPLTGLLTGALFGAYLLQPLLTAMMISAAETAGRSGDGWYKLQEIVVLAGAVTGLFGGLFAWRKVSAEITELLSSSPCLNNARIVAVEAASLETNR